MKGLELRFSCGKWGFGEMSLCGSVSALNLRWEKGIPKATSRCCSPLSCEKSNALAFWGSEIVGDGLKVSGRHVSRKLSKGNVPLKVCLR